VYDKELIVLARNCLTMRMQRESGNYMLESILARSRQEMNPLCHALADDPPQPQSIEERRPQ